MCLNGWFALLESPKLISRKFWVTEEFCPFHTVMTCKWKLTKIQNLEENLLNVHNSRVKKQLLQDLFMVVFMETRAFIFHLYYEDRRSRQRYSSPSFFIGDMNVRAPAKVFGSHGKKLRQTARCSATRRYETHGESFYFHLAFGKLIGYVMDWTRP